ncbi:hypothetical protein L9F63_000352 [Diploptera punctata]|uniref:Essential protein Yae1 N-terminal domain-containing protein n=1 Tax=Diploptera punctata TaxID=6984 RepID=A0AAD8EST1_DIPPU|nr:hypothetical protein L9F63_000352 [Diploptera punctata]
MSHNENDVDVGAWNKMHKNISQAGFREGIAAGKNSTYQNGFDIGYHEGYKNGLSLGYIKGAISILEEEIKNPTSKTLDPVLEKSSRGLCQLCEKPEQQVDSIWKLAEKQKQCINESVDEIRQKSVSLQGLILENGNKP